MKPLTWLIALLLAGNAILLAVLLGRQPSAPTATVLSSAKPGPAAANSTSDQALRRALESGDPAALAAAGCPPQVARELAAGRALFKKEARLRALVAKADRDEPHWRRSFEGLDGGARSMTRETRNESNRIGQDYFNEMRAALGTNPVGPFGPGNALLSFLPDATRTQLRRIEEDYDQMLGEIWNEAAGLQLPSDKEKLQLLKTEKERDIAALLGPELHQEFLSRTSATAGNVRMRYGSVIRDEAEYQAVYALQKTFDERFPASDDPAANAAIQKARREAMPDLTQAITALLGPDRYREAQRNNDPEYHALTNLSTRLNLPTGTAEALYASRDTYAAQSQQILANPALAPTERTARLHALADQAQAALQRTLGAGGVQAYAERSQWLRALKNGTAFSINPTGGVSIKSVPAPAPAPRN